MSEETKENLKDPLSNEEVLPADIKHEDLKLLLNWKNRSIHDWTSDDVKLGYLIRKRHYKPDEVLTDEERDLIGRLVLERSKTEDKIYNLSALRMWIPNKTDIN